MKVSEYASDVNLSVAEILKKCHELAINVNNKDDYLTDDDIIMLDNTINLISTDDEITFEEEEDIEDKVDEIMTSSRVDKSMKDSVSKEKLKKKDTSKQDFNLKKKEMYKHKNKLMKNETDENIVLYKNGMSVSEFANVLNVSGAEIIKKLMENGLMLSLNQPIDFENAEIIAILYNKTLKREETQDVTNFESYEIIDKEEDLVKRPPIVTIMGHVDHGASVTDIVIIIVAADDGVKPQTKEAVDHALSANVPIIVAVNKIDKPDANIERVLTEMAEIGITPEAWGGDIPFINISAHTGEGVELLLETILTIAEVNELKANPNRYAVGAVIESRLDKNVGGIASFLIQNGTLRLGDPIVVGTSYAKVRTMKNDRGESIVLAGPSTPVEITGLTENPSAGDKFMAFETEAEAKNVAQKRRDAAKINAGRDKKVSLDDLFASVDAGNKEINVVLKADVRGSEEAVKNALEKIKEKDVSVKVIRSGIGAISESDVVLASASNAIIIGFNVVASNNAKDIAKDNNIDIRLYTIIYKLVEDIEAAINGMLDPEYEEKVLGSAEVRKIFKFSKIGNIAGSYITSGIVKNGAMARVIRDGVVIASDEVIASLQREKDTVKEVKKGFECGITLEKFNDFKEGDTIEAYEMIEVKHA